MGRKHRIFTLLFCIQFGLTAQEKSTLELQHDSLAVVQKKLFSTKNDNDQNNLNNLFISILKRALSSDRSFDFAFDSLTEISRLTSPDKRFKIYNWNLAFTDNSYKYYGFIQVYNKKIKKYVVFELTDKSDELKNIENTVFTPEKWYGMLYYKIIPKKINRKMYYTLLAWDGNDNVSTKKIIDVVYFDEKGNPKFGENIFKHEKKSPKRVVFEYNSNAVMSLKYNEKSNMLIFDHLAPQNENLKGFYQFYVPDFSYDGFVFKKGKWNYVADVDAKNEKKDNDAFYNDPKSTGQPRKPANNKKKDTSK